jgi:opacity protein-like surface antigen
MSARHYLTFSLLAFVAPVAAAAQTPASMEPLSVSVRPAFHVTVGYAHAGWSDAALSGANGLALTASRHVAGPVRGVFDFATLSGNTLSGSGVAPARHYLVAAGFAVAPELAAGGHLVQPEVGVAIGTMVSDPAAGSSSTRSQNAWELFAGADVGVYGPFTLGLTYRHVSLRMQDVAALGPVIASTPLSAHVFEARLGVRF